jgi:hypothetical protein
MPDEATLPAVQVVGFFAAPQPVDRFVLEEALREQLRRLHASEARVLAISPLAEPADISFAGMVMETGLPLILLLLAPPEALAKTFSPGVRDELERILKYAATVEVLHSSPSETATTIHLAQRLVDQVNVLLVLQESEPAGPTAEMISYAIRRGRTVIRLTPTSGQMSAGEVAATEPRPVEGIDSLCAMLETPPPAPPIPAEVVRYFDTCDTEATRCAPQVRRYALNIVLANALASVAGSVSSSFPHSAAVGTGLTVVKFGAILLGLGIFAMLRHRESQNHWLRLRLKAEICRSMMATWNSPRVIEPFSADEVPEMGEVIRSLHYLRITQPPLEVSLEGFKAHYGVRRLAHQYRYFQKQSEAAKRISAWLTPVYWTLSGAALVTSAAALALQAHFRPGTWANFFFVFIPIVTPILASWVIAWQAIESVSRKKVRFAEMKRLMHQALLDLAHCHSWESVHHVAKRAEKVLLNEVLEWYSFVKLK